MVDRGHRATLGRMVAEASPYPPEVSCERLVESFADGRNRFQVFVELYRRGEAALPAIRAGFQHSAWQVRKWCAICADNFADAETLDALAPLVDDPRADVRSWAVHSLACQDCKDGPNPVDYLPLLLERIERDPSVRVRKQAVAMLAHHLAPDARVVPVFRDLVVSEGDTKVGRHAAEGLKRYATLGLV